MVFAEYFSMWDKYGVKLLSSIEITKEILNKAKQQNEICDLIWAINAANQNNKSVENLSETVMDQISKLSQVPSPWLLDHSVFDEYPNTTNKIKKIISRARRHYRDEHRKNSNSFKERQPMIKAYLEDYIKRHSNEIIHTKSDIAPFSQGENPTKGDIQAIYTEYAIEGENIVPGRLKELIPKYFQEQGRKLPPDWWEQTLKMLRNQAE